MPNMSLDGTNAEMKKVGFRQNYIITEGKTTLLHQGM